MSAFPDLPNHFVEWLTKQGGSSGGHFAPRAQYGRYLAELVEKARSSAPDRLELVRGEAAGIDLANGVHVRLSDGRSIAADAAVLALGNLPAAPPNNLDDRLLGRRYIADPWSPAVIEGLQPDDHVVIVGTGLTMVDVVLLLIAHGFQGLITAISRRGLIPRVQAPDGGVGQGLADRPSGEISNLLRGARTRAQAIGWHAAIDELRPHTQDVWRAATLEQKQRFLRHLRPWWDVHRHRLAPTVAQQIEALRACGRLTIVAGRTESFEPKGDGVEVAWRTRGKQEVRTLLASRIINCTGPQSDLSRSEEAILTELKSMGAAIPDPLGMGLSVDDQSRVLDARGKTSSLFAIGPLTRGTFWEIMAVPDIRVQTWNVAHYLANAHWVEWKGL